ncbi:hypothetical protein Y032_0071g596 [Ancylostoma ceylanicum]|uniref:Uncharacterized protein n=1 Tax=Ancylostoma ceylanicum TaxID=53326 RepID=A0A016TXH1_9BILA|nr:hypothetical protein Y032_0071g596 [Ancylostoma ceylanicum]
MAAKAAVAKAKNAALDKLYKKLDTSQAEKFVFRLAKARHRNSLDVTEAQRKYPSLQTKRRYHGLLKLQRYKANCTYYERLLDSRLRDMVEIAADFYPREIND